MIQGSIVALVTPMTEEGLIDWPALDTLLGCILKWEPARSSPSVRRRIRNPGF